jgi:uncharacterized protein (TIGR00369 family)
MDADGLKGIVGPELHERMDNILRMCNTPYAVANGIVPVSVSRGFVVLSKDVVACDLNSNGVVHGAASFGLMDQAFGMVCNIDAPTVGLSCNIIYHRPCFGGTMVAMAKVINESRSLMTIEVALHSDGKLIATATCIGFKTGKSG